MKKNLFTALLAGAIFFSGLGVGLFKNRPGFPPPPPHHEGTSNRMGETGCNYKFINPLRCETALISFKPEMAPLRQRLMDYIDQQKKQGKAALISVYFRDLGNGPVITINSEEKFTAASLLKVPVMIAYYKLAEARPEILEEKIGKDYEPGPDFQNVDDINKSISPHTEYTINELITKMIMYSDNRSKDLLLLNLKKISPNEDLFLSTTNDLGIIADTSNIDAPVSVKGMASIFRILYNASYLNNQMSEKALSLLDKTNFNDGLRSSLPLTVPLSHKFGVRTYDNGETQLHDCGILYLPQGDYTLCVMTKGKNTQELMRIIGDISSEVYKEIK